MMRTGQTRLPTDLTLICGTCIFSSFFLLPLLLYPSSSSFGAPEIVEPPVARSGKPESLSFRRARGARASSGGRPERRGARPLPARHQRSYRFALLLPLFASA